MPYSSVDELPAQTSKLSAKKKRQFMHVVNSALGNGDSEEAAFKQAWSAVSKELYSWDVIERQVDQLTANYNPTAGTQERMCAGCNWFVSPDSCVVVMGTISPTGVSDFYREREVYEPTPIPVTIVDSDKAYDEDEEEEKKKKKNMGQSIKEFAQTMLERFGLASSTPVQDTPVQFSIDKEGRRRFTVVYSNQFKDREASILTEVSHKEFEQWADQTGHYPELWFWHAKGAKLGQIDWLHYANGMACASGYIDKEAEPIVDRMEEAFGRLGVSHGFFSAATRNGLISKYRTYEISLLPIDKAANQWTTVNLLKGLEDNVMAFSEQKRQALLALYGNQDVVNQFERDTEAMAEALRASGIEHKEIEEVDGNQVVLQVVKEFGDYAKAMNESLAALTARVEASEKDFDTKFTEAWTSKVAELPKAFEASSDPSTVVDSKEAAALKPSSLEEWLNKAYSVGVGN